MPDQPITLDDVKRVDARPGDVLVFRADGITREDELDWLYNHLDRTIRHLWHGQVRFLVLTGGVSLDQVLSRNTAGQLPRGTGEQLQAQQAGGTP